MNRSRSKSNALSTYLGVFVVVLAMITWELLGRSHTSFRLLASSPSLMLAHIAGHPSDVLLSLTSTGIEAALGLILAISIGISFAAVFLYLPRLAQLTYPWFVASQIIPFVCLAPLIILVFGAGPEGKIFLSALMAFFPVLTNLVAGIKAIPRPPMELMQLMKAPRRMVVRHVVVPFSLGYFFAGLRVAAPFSVIGAIVAEFNGADRGIGKDIFISAKRLEPEVMMVGILSGAALSAIIYLIVLCFERSIGEWYWEE